MDTWIVCTFNPYAYPKIQHIEIKAIDINDCISKCGASSAEIICIKLKVL